MMVLVNGFMIHSLKHRIRRRGFKHYYGPLICTLVAAPLIMADLTRHVLSDWNVWQWCGNNLDFPRINQTWDNDVCFWSSTEYVCDVVCCVPGQWNNEPAGTYPLAPLDEGEACTCDLCTPPSQENIHHLSFIGWLFTICFTYAGFIMLATGTLWNASIIKKLRAMRERWRELRGQADEPVRGGVVRKTAV